MKLEVPRIPPSGNEMRRKYRTVFAYRDLRLLWEHDLGYATGDAFANQQLRMQAQQCPKLKVSITVFRAKELDRDNAMAGIKPVLDALKNLKFIADDSPERLELDLNTVPGKRKVTVLVIEAKAIDPPATRRMSNGVI